MKQNVLKISAIVLFTVPLVGVGFFSRSTPLAQVSSAADAAETYKSKCAMCHSPKAEKYFDTAKKDEELVEITLKGKKGEKPPYMPGYEAKGMTADEAKALVTYMRSLREANK